MKLDIQSIHFTADIKLLEFIQLKVDKLETFYDRITGGEVFLRLNKDAESKRNKIVEIQIRVPGATLFAKEQDISFEAATDLAVEALKTQIKKHKDKVLEKQHAASVPSE